VQRALRQGRRCERDQAGGSNGEPIDFRHIYTRLVGDAGISPLEVWEIPWPDVEWILEGLNAHPPLRLMVSRFFEYGEREQ
jgi:hypothetical protein